MTAKTGNGMSSSMSGVSAVGQYILDTKDEASSVATFTRTDISDGALVKKFEATAASITSPQDLLDNYSALKVVLGAYGMSSVINETAVLKDLMTQDPTAKTSLAHTSGNATWQAFAKAFSSWSTPPLASAGTVSTIVQGYMTGRFETSEGQSTPGLDNALYFTRKASGATTLSELMSDSTLLKVVETVNGYDPTEFGALDYDQQVQMLQGKVDMKDFSTPQKIQRYAERYLAILQFDPQKTTTPPTLLTLYGADGTDTGILSLFTPRDSSTSNSLLSLLG